MNNSMKAIGERIRTQDNRCTDQPIFIVQQKRRIFGIDRDYTDDHAWVDNDGCEITCTEEIANLEELEDDGHCGDYRKVGYVDVWEFVTACFTEQGCKDYLELNGHNLDKPRIYATSSYRNNEFRAVRDFLIG